VLFRDPKNSPHIATLRIGQPNHIPTARFCRCAIRKHVDDYLKPSVATMHMRRRMIVRKR
jgi:hypothetical protein